MTRDHWNRRELLAAIGGVGAMTLLPRSASAQAGPAAVAAAPRTTFHVSAFGAAGDGQHDDTAAIRRAVAAAKQAGGGTVLLHRGRFMVRQFERTNTAIELRDMENVELRGAGVGATTIASLPFPGRPPHMVIVQDSKHVTVSHLTIDGALEGGREGHNLRIAGSSDVYVHHVESLNGRYYGMHIGGALRSDEGPVIRCVVSDCSIRRARRDCVDVKNPSGDNKDIFLQRLHIEEPSYGPLAEPERIDACLDMRGAIAASHIVCRPGSGNVFGIRLRGSGVLGDEQGQSYAQLSHFRIHGEEHEPGNAGALLLVEGVCSDVSHGRVSGGPRHGVVVRGRRTIVNAVQSSGNGGAAFQFGPSAAASRVTNCLSANSAVGFDVGAPGVMMTNVESLNDSTSAFLLHPDANGAQIACWRVTGRGGVVDRSRSAAWFPARPSAPEQQ